MKPIDSNSDSNLIDNFGEEWSKYNYLDNKSDEFLDRQFRLYCEPLDLNIFDSSSSVCADFGAGSGRWTARLLPYFARIIAVEPSEGGFSVLKTKFEQNKKIEILQETIGVNSITESSLDLAVSLGVLHHTPNTLISIDQISKKIKTGGFFLCYLYYDLEDKPFFYRKLFQLVNFFRKRISRMPRLLKLFITKLIALFIYLPFARIAKLASKLKLNISNFPLHHYANLSFTMMANDSLDRFGTTLEQRFNKRQIIDMLEKTNFDLSTLVFSDKEPFWTFSVQKK